MSELIELVRVYIPDRTAASEPDQRVARGKALGYLDSAYLADLPGPFFGALVRAAVYDPDPSFNRQFVEPLRAAFGAWRTQAAFLEVLLTGTNQERAGAARAWYWATLEVVDDLQARWERAALREFVANEDTDVRRCLPAPAPVPPS